MKKTIIGIDLGTTNCTMAYCFLEGEDTPEIVQFKIPQIINQSFQDEHCSLPSFIYFPLQEEIESGMAKLDWSLAKQYAVGFFAKERGKELSFRVIASAKSWLSVSGIDRKNSFLPLHAEDKAHAFSPLEAISCLLKHLREAWDYKMGETPFEKADILITVPASFDPSARELVKEAAELAGYPKIILLEEPQAAFYAWLYKEKEEWRKSLKVGDSILVADIGGGTTDFSLISAENEEGDLVLKRVAVGEHLLLGGDNIDLSLAYLAKTKLEDAGNLLDDAQFQSLIYACREAKEKLLSENPPKSADVAIMGRGSRLIGGSLKTKITLEEALQLVVEGFMPLVKKEEKSLEKENSGLLEIGLNYAEDARISSQLAKFLWVKKESVEEFVLPTAILFNGGTLKASALRDRLVCQIDEWAKELGQKPVQVLNPADLDYAVGLGAVYYGLSRSGKTVRIKSGTSKSYYVGVEDTAPAVPGIAKSMKAFCVAPCGMEEGSESEILNQEFQLAIGQKATFRFFSPVNEKLNAKAPAVGSIIKKIKPSLMELPSIEAHLKRDEGEGKFVRVKLQSKVTELGFLELWCLSHDGRKWKLEFNVRN
ncbi:MAG TPA: Hsp70 family protein [Parachlamydiaceae bacterium]|nr:Hsp70 family protein [Parachlamydiaceae bacterium]